MKHTSQTSTWLALGDSYTIGEGVLPEDRWPAQLAQQLRFAPPVYLAKTGWTTVDLLEAIEQANLAQRYDWVSVMIGVNDQYDGLSIEQFQQGFTQIVDFAISRVEVSERVVVLTIPDYSVTPFVKDKELGDIALAVAHFNSIIFEVAREEKVSCCDITLLSQRAAHDPSLLVEDGLHPSGKMYRMWAEKVTNDIVLPDTTSIK